MTAAGTIGKLNENSL
jgi:hypothetical protein